VKKVVGAETVQQAWARGQELFVHGWIYGVHDGLLRNLEVSAGGPGGPTP
jgi:carbonic anhydrase